MTVSLPRSAWATPENTRELQNNLRSLLRHMHRHGWLAAFGWVREVGANGRQLHRHFLIRLDRRASRGFRRGRWIPYARLQTVAKGCGLGTLDFQPIRNDEGAAVHVSKYLAKSVGQAVGRARRYGFSGKVPKLETEPGWEASPLPVAMVAVEYLGAVAVVADATFWQSEAPP
jgi:hypothetical protein